MMFTQEEVDWLIDSRSQRETRTIRLDRRLGKDLHVGISDIINLALKRYLEEKEIGKSQSSKGYREEGIKA